MVAPIERTIRTGGLVAIALLILLALAGRAPAAVPSQGGLSPVPAVSTAPAPPSTGPYRPFYPVRGPHEFWEGFGAGRGHQGADIGAACGTPLVAVGPAQVRMVKFHYRAGNYVVLDLEGSELDLAYMHMLRPASLRAGDTVAAGQVIGLVGATGNASGCHLHFEVWQGAYYGGGAPIDPVPLLQSWERERKRPRAKARR